MMSICSNILGTCKSLVHIRNIFINTWKKLIPCKVSRKFLHKQRSAIVESEATIWAREMVNK